MNKKENLKNTMFKLICNKPYNVVRRQVDKISRQIYEIDNKATKTTE